MKMMHKRYRFFTLVELLVAMGVFVVMLAMMLRFFSGTQQVWRGLKSRNEVFADARTAMDLMTSLLETSVAADRFTPLAVNGTVNTVRFLTRSPRALLARDPAAVNVLESIYLVDFSRTDAASTAPEWAEKSGVLVLKVAATPQSGYLGAGLPDSNFRPAVFDGTFSDQGSSIPVIKQVSELSFRRLVGASETADKNRPRAIEITLKVFDTLENYQTWLDKTDADEKNAFRAQHEYTFRRIVSFDDIAELIEE